MTHADPPPISPVRLDPDATPRAEEVVADAGRPDAPPHPGDDGEARGSDPDATSEVTTEPTEPHYREGEVADPQAQPVAGGSDDGPPAQGEGAPDSY